MMLMLTKNYDVKWLQRRCEVTEVVVSDQFVTELLNGVTAAHHRTLANDRQTTMPTLGGLVWSPSIMSESSSLDQYMPRSPFNVPHRQHTAIVWGPPHLVDCDVLCFEVVLRCVGSTVRQVAGRGLICYSQT